MKPAASHTFPEAYDLGEKLMTAANVTNAYSSLGSHQRLFMSEQPFQ